MTFLQAQFFTLDLLKVYFHLHYLQMKCMLHFVAIWLLPFIFVRVYPWTWKLWNCRPTFKMMLKKSVEREPKHKVEKKMFLARNNFCGYLRDLLSYNYKKSYLTLFVPVFEDLKNLFWIFQNYRFSIMAWFL